MSDHLQAPIPDEGIFDNPGITICLNSAWASHVDGALQALLHHNHWQGTYDEQDAAVQQVKRLMVALQNGADCECPYWLNGARNGSEWAQLPPATGLPPGVYNIIDDRFEGVWNNIHNSYKLMLVSRAIAGTLTDIFIDIDANNTRGTTGIVQVFDSAGNFINSFTYLTNGLHTLHLTPNRALTGDLKIGVGVGVVDNDDAAHVYITRISICTS